MFTKIHLKFLWIIIFALASTIFFGQKSFAATYITESTIDTNTTWTKENSPYIISSSIAVMENAILTIEPGVEIKFQNSFQRYNKFGISVFGSIQALGGESAPIYFTSNNDDFLSNTDDEEICNIEEYDEEGNLILKDECEYYDFDDPFAEDWNGIYLNNASGKSIFNYVDFNYSKNTIVSTNSQIEINKVNISNSYQGLLMYQNSFGTAKELNFSYLERDAIVLFNDSFLNFEGINISNIYDNPISVFNNSSLSGKTLKFYGDLLFENYSDAIDVFNGSSLSLEDSNFKYCPTGSCIAIFDGRSYTSESSSLNINSTDFKFGLGEGISVFGDSEIPINVNNSSFDDFNNYAISNFLTNQSFRLNFENNYFGDATGPYHEILNPDGQGERIIGNIDFKPYLESNPFEKCISDCVSNIIFIPGMQGSRLYEQNGNKDRELWFSIKDSYHKSLFLDEEGKSLNTIYTKNDTRNNGEAKETGIVDEAIFGLKIYDSFINELRNLKSEKIINDYSLIPYDWRLSLEDIIRNGKTFGDKNQNLSYLEPQAFDESFIYQELSKLAKSSKNGKVSIIAHSNGGLVTKALLQKLKDTENPLYDKIDKIFLVAVPQIGTPEAMIALLYGTGIGPMQLIMDKDISRGLADNMPTAYNLIPRQSYFDLVPQDKKENRLINFIDHQDLKDAVEKYGLEIDKLNELEEYLLGEEGREKPDIYDLKKANTLNINLYNNAKEVYQMLDTWQPGDNMRVIQVGGWGMETKIGLDYKEYKNILLGKYLSYKVRETVNGDGTVVLPSALYMNESTNVEKWLVDLLEYRSFSGKILPIKHADILEIPQLLSFIKSKIQNINFEDSNKIILKDKSNTLPKDKKLIYTLHSPLYLGVFDSEGKFTGRDEKGILKQEIPGVEYDEVGEVQTLSIPIELAHTLKLYGYEEGVFALDVDLFLNDKYSSNNLFQGIKTGPNTVVELSFTNEDSLKNLKLALDYEGDGIYEEEFLPEKEEVIVEEVKKVENPGGVVLTQFLNQNTIPLILGEAIENVIPEIKIVKAEEVKEENTIQQVEASEENPKNKIFKLENDKDLQIQEDPAFNQNNEKELINVEPIKKSNNYKLPIVVVIISLILISLKFIFKVL